MCGIVGFLRQDRAAGDPRAGGSRSRCSRPLPAAGPTALAWRRHRPRARAWRGRRLVHPDSPERRTPRSTDSRRWRRQIPLPVGSARAAGARHCAFRFMPNPGDHCRAILNSARRPPGGPEVLSLGRRLDLVKQVGSPAQLEAAYCDFELDRAPWPSATRGCRPRAGST